MVDKVGSVVDRTYQEFTRVIHSVSRAQDFAATVLILGSKLNGPARMVDIAKMSTTVPNFP